MHHLLSTPFVLNTLTFTNRIIQGPLAGYSCSAFRKLPSFFSSPAYCVSEMLSAYDILYKHQTQSRYLARSPAEKLLCYQIAGNSPAIMAAAAQKLVSLGADLIDINCGCPKTKIRKKGLGSALLEQPEHLAKIIFAVRQAIAVPLTVKIRLQESTEKDIALVKKITNAGADAIIIHGRRWQDEYDIPCNLKRIGLIKETSKIPLIVNGDIKDRQTILAAFKATGCDAFMISRAGCGNPWLFHEILHKIAVKLDKNQLINLFMLHLSSLAELENEYKAALQSRSLVRYYFKHHLSRQKLLVFYQLKTLAEIEAFLIKNYQEY